MELLNPNLDNDLGGSWRPSMPLPLPPVTVVVPREESGWHYRKGTLPKVVKARVRHDLITGGLW
jgi:hypothetical protein